MNKLNNIYNYKFYHKDKSKELNWSIWYFPTINTSESLKVIDEYSLLSQISSTLYNELGNNAQLKGIYKQQYRELLSIFQETANERLEKTYCSVCGYTVVRGGVVSGELLLEIHRTR